MKFRCVFLDSSDGGSSDEGISSTCCYSDHFPTVANSPKMVVNRIRRIPPKQNIFNLGLGIVICPVDCVGGGFEYVFVPSLLGKK